MKKSFWPLLLAFLVIFGQIFDQKWLKSEQQRSMIDNHDFRSWSSIMMRTSNEPWSWNMIIINNHDLSLSSLVFITSSEARASELFKAFKASRSAPLGRKPQMRNAISRHARKKFNFAKIKFFAKIYFRENRE